MRQTKDRLILQANVFYFQKYATTSAFDDELILYVEHGLIGHMFARYKRELNDGSSDMSESPRVLLLQSLYGCIIILIVMLSLCGLVFWMELLSAKYASIRRTIDFLTY